MSPAKDLGACIKIANLVIPPAYLKDLLQVPEVFGAEEWIEEQAGAPLQRYDIQYYSGVFHYSLKLAKGQGKFT
jgi:hypothetical protein